MKKGQTELRALLADFLAGKRPSSDLVDRRQRDPIRPPGMPHQTYNGGSFPPYWRGLDPGAVPPRHVPETEWFGTVGPYLPDELNPGGNETPFPLQNFIRLVIEQQARKPGQTVTFPRGSGLGRLQQAMGVRSAQPNRAIRTGGK